MLTPDDIDTLVPCPACETCATCEGTGKVTCFRCPLPHSMACPADSTCGMCEGTQLCSPARRYTWIRSHPPPPESAE